MAAKRLTIQKNERSLRDAHVKELREPDSVALYDAALRTLIGAGNCTPVTQKLLRDACVYEDVIVQANRSLREDGLMETFSQGKQQMPIVNRVLKAKHAAGVAQSRIFKELRLLPRGRAEDDDKGEEEADAFADF